MDVASVRVKSLINMKEASKPMDDADFDTGTAKAAELAAYIQIGG